MFSSAVQWLDVARPIAPTCMLNYVNLHADNYQRKATQNHEINNNLVNNGCDMCDRQRNCFCFLKVMFNQFRMGRGVASKTNNPKFGPTIHRAKS
jgi:hypothetical protein